MISETRSNFVLEHGEMEANQRSQKRLWACVVFLLVATYVQTVSILLRDSFETALPCFSLLRVFIAAPRISSSCSLPTMQRRDCLHSTSLRETRTWRRPLGRWLEEVWAWLVKSASFILLSHLSGLIAQGQSNCSGERLFHVSSTCVFLVASS